MPRLGVSHTILCVRNDPCLPLNRAQAVAILENYQLLKAEMKSVVTIAGREQAETHGLTVGKSVAVALGNRYSRGKIEKCPIDRGQLSINQRVPKLAGAWIPYLERR